MTSVTTGELLAALGGTVAAPLVVAALIGAVRWLTSRNRLLGKVTELVDRVGDLADAVTAATRDALVLREQFTAHCRQADERWGLILGGVPAPRPGYDGPERRAHPRPQVIEGTP